MPHPVSPAPSPFGRVLGEARWFCGLVLLTLLVYWPALRGGMLWDDPAHVTRLGLQSWPGLWRIWFEVGVTQEYYPVLHSAFWIQHRWWGDAMLGYHLVNVLLHAANSYLLACLLRRLWSPGEAAPAGRAVPAGAAWLAAALLAVHPVCVESVAWITEQKNTLSMFFYFLSALCYLDFVRRRTAWPYLLGTVLFVLTLGAKTMTVTLPPALLVLLWWKQGRLAWRRDVLPLAPWFALALGAGLITTVVEGGFVGAELVVPDLSLLQRTLLAAKIFWFYLGKLLWPADLTFFYPLWDVAAEAGGWTIHLLAGLGVTGILWHLRHRARGPLAAWLLYGGTLFPVLGFFKVFAFSFSYVADHFQYLAIPVVLAAGAAGLALAHSRMPARPRRAGPVLAGALVLLLALVARGHSRLYQSNETLFRANITANPQSWMGHHILAHTVGQSPARRDEAVALYRKAIGLKADNADSRAALAALLVGQPGQAEEAIALFREAVRLRPTFAEAHNGLANELAAFPEHLPEAIMHYETALRLRPRFGLARANLAQALARMPGREAEALACFDEVLRLMPDHAPSHYHLANLLAAQAGRQVEAVSHYEAAIRLSSDSPEPHAGLAQVLARLGRLPEAIPHFETVLRLQPGSVNAHYSLANALARTPGRQAEAVAHYEAALRGRPGSAEIHANFANTLAQLPGRLPEAFTHYEKALELDPQLPWVHYNVALHLAEIPDLVADALAHAREALRLKPDYPEVLNLLGIIHARQGRVDEARDCWNRALQLRPDFEPARRNLRLLQPDAGR